MATWLCVPPSALLSPVVEVCMSDLLPFFPDGFKSEVIAAIAVPRIYMDRVLSSRMWTFLQILSDLGAGGLHN